MPETKAWWRSKTLWVNTLVAALAAAEAGWNVLQPMLPVSFWRAIAFGLPLVNVVLRVITTQGLGK